jgi:hypothetical protein
MLSKSRSERSPASAEHFSSTRTRKNLLPLVFVDGNKPTGHTKIASAKRPVAPDWPLLPWP